LFFFDLVGCFFSSRRRHTSSTRDWSSTCALPISFGLPERELRNRKTDPTLDPFGAERDLVVALAFPPLPGAVRVSHRHAYDGNRDRKSTRLNSSHEWISYAVFCLKKKKKTDQKLQ